MRDVLTFSRGADPQANCAIHNLASRIDCVRLQYFQGVSSVAGVLKLNNSLVEGLQIVFQSTNFALYWK
jgi:hypothetical protein